MSFVETVERARHLIKRSKRLSLRALRLEFDLDAEKLEVLVEELVDVLQVVVLEDKVLIWIERAEDGEGAIQDQNGTSQSPHSVVRAERRQLTLLFCDLVGSTNLSRRMDEEDYRDLVKTYHEAGTAAVTDFGGHVAEYLGDGLLVYFGFPRAQEDDAEHAVRAGRAIIDAVQALNPQLEQEGKPALAVRVGINTGPVVVSAMGSGHRQEMRAVGEAVNVAASLQSEAEPDTIVISSSTLQLVKGRFLTRDLGSKNLKGIAMHLYEVLSATGVQDRLDLDPSGLTPLVGRERELGILRDHWQQVKGGYGKAILLSGEGGLGKSRIVRTFRDGLAEESHHWIECHCSRHKQDSAYYPLVELISRRVGFEVGDTDEVKLDRLITALDRVGFSTPEAVALIATQLSLRLPPEYSKPEYSPEIRRRKTNTAFCGWLLAAAAEKPLVMLVEDVHWSDQPTIEFLSMLLKQCPNASVLVLLSFRPEFEIPWRTHSNILHLEVLRLVQGDAERLVHSLNDGEPLPSNILERIVGRADGVPLFLEELTKMVIERRDSDIREGKTGLSIDAIPSTLHDSLMARLDRLGQGKQIAQFSAVLGRRFSYELLKAISPVSEPELMAALQGLVDANLLHAPGTASEAAYSFKHALIHDTAYQSLLHKERRDIHATTARVFEEQFPERTAAEPELVARHYDEAGLGKQAATHYGIAASNAKRRFAYEETIAYLRRALDMVDTLSESPERDLLELDFQVAIGQPLSALEGFENAEFGRRLERAHDLAEQLKKTDSLYGISMSLNYHHQFAGALTKSEGYARRAVELAEPDSRRIRYLLALSSLSQTLYLKGEFVAAAENIEQMLDVYYSRERGSESVATGTKFTASSKRNERKIRRHLELPIEGGAAAALYGVNALCHWALGYPDTALELCETALESAKLLGSPDILTFSYIYLAWIQKKRRVQDEAMSYSQQACDIGERHGLSMLRFAKILRGSIWDDIESIELHSAEGALNDILEGIEALEESGTKGWLPHCFTSLAKVYNQLGRHGDALKAVIRGLECSAQTGSHYEDSSLMLARGEALRASGEMEAAEKSLRESLETAKKQQAKSLELSAATSLAKLWQSQGRGNEAHSLLAPIHSWFSEGFENDEWQTASSLLEELSSQQLEMEK